MMIQIFNKYKVAQVAHYSRYRDFLVDFYPNVIQIDPRTLGEYSSLIQRTFSESIFQPLPKYLFWRKTELGLYLRPTFDLLMGQEKSHNWLLQNAML